MERTEFLPCGVLTLTTDIGHKGPFVATMKGVMLTRFAAARIVDLTHESDVHFPGEAGFWLAHAYRFFPPGTVHVGVVDPGVGTERRVIALVHEGHAFLAPDNGLLGALAERDGAVAFDVDLSDPAKLGLETISDTFHGRDILAPLAADLAAGARRPEELGPRAESVVPAWIEEPTDDGRSVRGVVVAADNFGNLITNIDRRMLERFREPIVEAAGRKLALRRTYGNVTPGDYLALINSFDALEIARAERSAAESLGIGRGAPVTVRES